MTNSQKIVVFDDYVTKKNNNKSNQLFCPRTTLKLFSYLFNTKLLRLSGNDKNKLQPFCLFDFPGNRERNLIARELGIDKDKTRQDKIYFTQLSFTGHLD